jgi:hypothetical protein
MSDSPYRWIDTESGSYYHLRYSCIAAVKPVRDGVEVVLQNQRGKEVRAMEPSIRLAKRHVERWFAAERNRPMGPRKG